MRKINFPVYNLSKEKDMIMQQQTTQDQKNHVANFSKFKALIQKLQYRPWHVFLAYFKKLQFNCLYLHNQTDTFEYNKSKFDQGSTASIVKLKLNPKCKEKSILQMEQEFKKNNQKSPMDLFVCKLSNHECSVYNEKIGSCKLNRSDFVIMDDRWFVGNMMYYDHTKNIVVCLCESLCELIVNMYINSIYYNYQCIHCNVQHLAGIDISIQRTFQVQEMIDIGLDVFIKKQIESSWIKQKYFDKVTTSPQQMESSFSHTDSISLFDSSKSSISSRSNDHIKDIDGSFSRPSIPSFCAVNYVNNKTIGTSFVHPNRKDSLYDEQEHESSNISSFMDVCTEDTNSAIFSGSDNSFTQMENDNKNIKTSIESPFNQNMNNDSINQTIDYLCIASLYYCHAIQQTYKINSLDLSIRNVMVQFVNDQYPVRYGNVTLKTCSKNNGTYFIYCFNDPCENGLIRAIAVPFKGYIFKFIDNGMSKLYDVTGEKSDSPIEFSYFYYQSVFTKEQCCDKNVKERCKHNKNVYGMGHRFSSCYDMHYFIGCLCKYLSCFNVHNTRAHYIQNKYDWFLEKETHRPRYERFYDNIHPKDVLNHLHEINRDKWIKIESFLDPKFPENISNCNPESVLYINRFNRNDLIKLSKRHVTQYCC